MAKNAAVEVAETIADNTVETAQDVAHIVSKSKMMTPKNLVIAGAAVLLTTGAVVAYKRFRNRVVVIVDENPEV